MKKLLPLFALSLLYPLSSCDMPDAAAAPDKPHKAPASAGKPVVVELYQSQGCSSCPPANAALNAIADRKDMIALSFAVTYWDRLGWKDTFAAQAYTDRQHAYAAAMGSNRVYTPQVILNGRSAIVGNAPGEIDRAVARTAALPASPSIAAANGSITIGAGKGRADVLLVRYDPRVQQVSIRAGENGGQKLPHRNIVRQLVSLGAWNGKPATFKLPANPNPAWRSAIIVQAKNTGPILTAAKL
jgi:hypothetical protein